MTERAQRKLARIFMSHIHEEDTVAAATQHLIETELTTEAGKHCEVFRVADRYQVRAGEDWLDRIRKEIAQSSAVILMLSKESIRRPWVNFEAGAAWMHSVPLICACYAGQKKGKLPKPYSNLQALDLEKDAYYLVQSVGGWIDAPVPVPLPTAGLLDQLGPDLAQRQKLYERLQRVIQSLSWDAF
jgi:TIR domain-containing protein